MYYCHNEKAYDFHNSLMEAFEESVDKYPEHVALIFKDQELTYRQFNEKVNQYAAYFRRIGIKKETPVGIHMQRSLEMMIGIYAVLKAGGAYVPLDPDYPEDRLCFIAEDLGLQLILNNVSLVSPKLAEGRQVLSLEELEEQVATCSRENALAENLHAHMAYIIFTSGSTGKPKGAVIEHKAALNRLYWMQDYLQLKPGEKVLQKTPISFDVSVWELFWPLMYGATLVIAEPGGHKEPSYLVEIIKKQQITTIHFVPSMLQAFLMFRASEDCTSLKRVVCSGEALEEHHAVHFFERLPECGLFNLYGPTEATVDVTYYEVKKDEVPNPIPIGRAVSNCELYILDENLKPVPFGGEGELYIGGLCLSRGYFNRPELNQERFIKNPFSEDTESHLYKTGDLAKFREDGEIVYIGRSDFQVKLRGLRIELGEIENSIRKTGKVKDVVVTVYKDKELNDSQLLAYVIPEEEKEQIEEGDKNRVEEWKAIFDDTYAEGMDPDNDAVESDYSGWMSSYTGERIPDADMEKWVNTTVERIEGLNNKKILELGCGTGLLLYKLAPHVERFVGIDLSDVAVENLNKDMKERGPEWQHVSVYQGSADDLSMVENEKFDCIVINSVIQLFPSIEYLYKVIENARNVLSDGGKIFIGDVRDLKFLEIFHASVQYYKDNAIQQADLKKQTAEAVYNDKELLISQDFFKNLQGQLKEITAVELMTKQFDVVNELSKFRYDVVLYKNRTAPSERKEVVYDYQKQVYELEELKAILMKHTDSSVKLIHVPNTILCEEQYIQQFMEDEQAKKPDTFDVSRFLPAKFYQIGKECGRRCFVNMKSVSTMEVMYCKDAEEIYSVMEEEPNLELDELGIYATNPMRKGKEEQVVQAIRENISLELPDYMVPAQFIFMETFPLLPNGKLNRKELPIPESKAKRSTAVYVAPKTEFECEVCELWAKLLKIQQVGIEDSFFELGGHSLLAIKFFNILAERYGKQISLSKFMKNPTIQGLSVLFEEKEAALSEVRYEKAEPEKEHQYEPFALSDMQQAYYIGRSNEVMYGGVSTHVYTEFEIPDLDCEKFERALNDLIQRHGMLRCIIREDSTQEILETVPYYKIAQESIIGSTKEECEAFIESVRDKMFYKESDLSQYPLFEVRMTKTDKRHTRIHICYDNIVLDGASQGIMVEDMLHLYRMGKESLKPIEFSFRDYLLAEQRFQKEEPYQKAMEYWKGRCKTMPESPKLPICAIEEDGMKRRVQRKEAVLSKQVWNQLKEYSKQWKVTPNTLLISAFSEVIERWSGSKHFCLNLPTFNRFPFHADVENMLGEFGSIYLLEVDRTLGGNFLEKTQSLQQQFWKDMDYNSVTGVDVLRELAVYQENVLMPVVFTSLLTHDKRRSFLHEEVDTVYWRSQSSQVWLDAVVSEREDALCIDWDYVEGLFEESMITDMFEAYVKLLNDLAQDETLWKQTELDVLPKKQRIKREEYNRTEEEISENYLHELFYDSVKKYPEHIACVEGDTSLTYKELYQYAIYLAEKLERHKVQPNELVAILLPKGWRQVAAALGVLFAGAAYLPLDVKWPEVRLQELLTDAKVNIVITSQEMQCTVKDGQRILELPGEQPEGELKPWIAKQKLDDLAYVIYTSGSTGKPKGVAITHRAANNTIIDINQKFHITDKDRAIGLSEMNFDLSVYDMFGMFAAGGAIVIPTEQEKNNVLLWQELVLKHRVTVWNTVPSLMDLFLSECQKPEECFHMIHTILLSGDWIPVVLPDKIRAFNRDIQISSLGGATEASIWSIYYPIQEQTADKRSIPYGRPLANQTFYVLDETMRDCPEYVTGELFIGGKGLAQCYFGDEKKTKEKFLIHPITKERLYATGDLGRFLDDNNIEFIGRKDFQIKLNGYRIELGEIEAVLSQLEQVKKCIVDVKESKDKRNVIAAFYTAEQEIDKAEMVAYLEERIPHYMIPAYFVYLPEIPVTDNGKINRKALLIPENQEVFQQDEENETENEVARFLLETCRELLNFAELKFTDDFFSCGGNSIIIMRLMARIQSEYHISLRMRELFCEPRFSAWKRLIEDKIKVLGKENSPKEQETYKTEAPLTFAQEGMLLNEIIYQKGLNVLSASMKISGKLDIDKLEKAIEQTIQKHPMLNIRIQETKEGHFIQKRCEEISDVLLVIPFEEDMEYLPDYFIEKAEWQFEVLSGKLYDFELLCLGNDEYLFAVTLHHIISDEFTFEIVFQDIQKAYQGQLNTEYEWEYGKYAYEQRQQLDEKVKEACLSYWKEKLPKLLIYDLYENGQQEHSEEGTYQVLELSKENFKKLMKLCSEHETSMFAGVMAVYAIAISHVLEQKKIAIGFPISDRSRISEEKSCGLFINMSVLCVEINVKDSYLSILKKVGEELIKVIEQSSLPFEVVVRELNLGREYYKIPYNINMNVLAAKQQGIKIEGVEFAPFEFTKHLVGHNIGLLLEEKECKCSLSYRNDISKKYVEGLVEQFEKIFRYAAEYPESALENIF